LALAMAGTLTQGVTRNPLASPEILGISSGAGLAAVALIVVAPAAPAWAIPFGAFAGASLVAIAIFAFAWRGGVAPVRLILVGIGFSALATAGITIMTTFGTINRVTSALVWLAGSVYGRGWEQVVPLLPWLVIGGGLAILSARQLDTLGLGDDVAAGLGVAVQRQRLILLIVAVALAASAVATAGAIAFVGLMAPHLARRLVGPGHAALLPAAALVGAVLVVAADLVGRMALAPIEIPCGLITAIVGAPYFLYLVLRGR
jgi:iron complex transport system permease protein